MQDGKAAMANGAAARVFGETFSTVAEAAFMTSGQQFRSYHGPSVAHPPPARDGHPSAAPPAAVPPRLVAVLAPCLRPYDAAVWSHPLPLSLLLAAPGSRDSVSLLLVFTGTASGPTDRHERTYRREPRTSGSTALLR